MAGGGMPSVEWRVEDEAGTEAVGEWLARRLLPDGTILLEGELGVGKTVLTRGVARALGIDPAEIQSPTFTLWREHSGPGGRLLHADLYRLTPLEARSAGFEEWLAEPGVKVVEWAERLGCDVPEAVRVRLTRRPDGGRAARADWGPEAPGAP